jgi:hypothetical protein
MEYSMIYVQQNWRKFEIITYNLGQLSERIGAGIAQSE